MAYQKEDKELSNKADHAENEQGMTCEKNLSAKSEHIVGRGRSRRRPSCEVQTENSDFSEIRREENICKAAPAKQKKAKKKKKKRKSLSLPSLPKIKLPGSLSTLVSRISQIVCCLLMANAVWVPLLPLFHGREGLGSVRILITERNYSLACYLALAGSYLAFTSLSAFWILTKRHFAGNDRVISADMGRGMTAFLLLTLIFWSLPMLQTELSSQPLLPGASRFLEVMAPLSESMLKICIPGFLLSLLRRILKR